MRNSKFNLLATMSLMISAALVFQACDEEENEPTNNEPTCSITNPSFGDEITQGETITITVEAEDEDNNLKEVRFYIDGTGVGSSNSFPYNYEWETGDASEGSHTIKAVAIDEEQAEAEDEVEVTVLSGGGGTTGTFTDPRDDQTYETVEIGDQTWMAENLNYETDNSWWYDNDPDNGETYGRLYTWEAALNACPDGWHLPSDEEWYIVVDYLGGSGVAGGKMKEAGTTHWNSPNTGATNSSGFTALPGGGRRTSGSFHTLGSNGSWWSSTERSGSRAWYRNMYYARDDVSRYGGSKYRGFSVRCLKD